MSVPAVSRVSLVKQARALKRKSDRLKTLLYKAETVITNNRDRIVTLEDKADIGQTYMQTNRQLINDLDTRVDALEGTG